MEGSILSLGGRDKVRVRHLRNIPYYVFVWLSLRFDIVSCLHIITHGFQTWTSVLSCDEFYDEFEWERVLDGFISMSIFYCLRLTVPKKGSLIREYTWLIMTHGLSDLTRIWTWPQESGSRTALPSRFNPYPAVLTDLNFNPRIKLNLYYLSIGKIMNHYSY